MLRRTGLVRLALVSALVAVGVPAQGYVIEATGLVPLTDLGQDVHAGEQGGLYPDGFNMRPPQHDADGLHLAAQVEPLDALGQPDPAHGRVVLLMTGMSNAKLIGHQFTKLAGKDPLRSKHVTVVNGGHAGKSAELMSDPMDPFWNFLRKDLIHAKVTPEQVQVVWLHQSQKDAGVPFPQHAESLADQLGIIAQLLKGHFPNLKLLYLTSRIYGGLDTSGTSSEPHAYEANFGVKFVIERQLQGAPELNFQPAAGPVLAPWMAWGPYLWADGTIERSDGLTWTKDDFGKDGVHPSSRGALKAAEKALAFFHTDATARTWYLARQSSLCPKQAIVMPYGPARGYDHVDPHLGTSILPAFGAVEPLMLYVRDASSGAPGWFIVGQPASGGGYPVAGGTLFVDPATARIAPVTTNANGQAWLDLGFVPPNAELSCGAALYAQYVTWSSAGFSFTRPIEIGAGH
jgi:hypothetical protein